MSKTLPSRSSPTVSFFKAIDLAALIIFLFLITRYALLQPIYNWDVLGYMASALSFEEKDPTTLHRRTFHAAKDGIPEDSYRKFLDDESRFIKTMRDDPLAFSEQLYVYQQKPLYVALIYGLNKAAVPLPFSTVMISALAVFLTGVLLYVWVAKMNDIPGAGFLTIVTAAALRAPYLSRLSTPDALSALMILFAFYLICEKKAVGPGIGLLMMSCLARVDNAVMASAGIFYFSYFAPPGHLMSKRKARGALIVLIMMTLLIRHFAHAQSWWTQFRHGFMGLTHGFSQNQQAFSPRIYADVFGLGLARVLWDPQYYSSTPMYLLLGIVIIRFSRFLPHDRLAVDMIKLVLAVMAVRYVLFPVFEDRFYFVNHALIVIFGLRAFLVSHRSKTFQK